MRFSPRVHNIFSSRKGFTIHDLILLLGIIAVVLIMLAALGLLPYNHNTQRVRRIQNLTQMRHVAIAMVEYAEDHPSLTRSTHFFPGLNPDGSDGYIDVEQRLQLLIDGEYIHPEQLVNPYDDYATVWQDEGNFLQPNNYSYALLQIPSQGARRAEWAKTFNSGAIIIADQNTGTPENPEGHRSGPGEQWDGGVVYADLSAALTPTHHLDTTYAGIETPNDNIFHPAGNDDAYLIHSGNALPNQSPTEK